MGRRLAKHNYTYYVGDFETTVYDGQSDTEVWASALVPLYSEKVIVLHSIEEQWDYIRTLEGDLCIYYHNLKFDGTFWLSYFLTNTDMKQALLHRTKDLHNVEWLPDYEMQENSFKYSISMMGTWYSITVRIDDRFIEFRDSLKLLPFSLRKIGKSFGTKHQKLDMEYTGYRYAGCEITPEEKKYIANDVLVIKEALEIMFDEGHSKLTIGSCCLDEFKKTLLHTQNPELAEYNEMFPQLYDIQLEPKYDYLTAGDYIRSSYHGGWCYVVKGKEDKIFSKGLTADVNSLYPSMMSSQSGNKYPVGQPEFWSMQKIPPELRDYMLYGENGFLTPKPDRYFFVRIRTRFKIKEGMLPTIQIKNCMMYSANEWLETSDYFYDGAYHSFYQDKDGTIQPASVELVLTETDWLLINEHYDLYETEILDGCWFSAKVGIFDDYIEKYKKIKMTSKGAKRELAKLFLNNLYGKMASNKNSSFKVCIIGDKGELKFINVHEENKVAGYIAIGTAITSYARNFTIRTAQANYHGVDKRGFIYADTDSIHCDLNPDELVNVPVHPTDFCHWKLESYWDEAIFVRQKTYIEHITHEDGEPVDRPYHNIKCAGMSEKPKQLLMCSLAGEAPKGKDKLTKEDKQFLFKDGKIIKRSLDDFRRGLSIPGKLMPKRIKGGTLLVETTYQMR